MGMMLLMFGIKQCRVQIDLGEFHMWKTKKVNGASAVLLIHRCTLRSGLLYSLNEINLLKNTI